MLLAVLALLAVTPTGCGRAADRGPAWPKPAASETDGGESLAPRQASSVAAIEESGEATPSVAVPAPAAAGPTVTPAAAAARPAETPPPKEPDPLMVEEIIIEIDD